MQRARSGTLSVDPVELELTIFKSVDEGARENLLKLFANDNCQTEVLQVVLTTTIPNHDGQYGHDEDVKHDAAELLGTSVENLNAIQIAAIMGEDEIALDILEFVVSITEDIGAKKVLNEFVGRVWGDGNTLMHLASFYGMSTLVQRLLSLGASRNRRNSRGYRPVDCVDDFETRKHFLTYEIENSSSNRVQPERRLRATSLSDLEKTQMRDLLEERTASKTLSLSGSFNSSTASSSVAQLKSVKSSPVFSELQELAEVKPLKESSPKILTNSNKFGDPIDGESLPSLKSLFGITDSSNVPSFDPNSIRTPHQSLTLLHSACTYGRLPIVKLLLSLPFPFTANVNVTDTEGWTPLHCAAAEGRLDIVNELGKCQGRNDNELDQVFYGKSDSMRQMCYFPPDGPLCVGAINGDGETPIDVVLEGEAGELIKTTLRNLASSIRVHEKHAHLLERHDAEDDVDEEDCDSSEESLQSAPALHGPSILIGNKLAPAPVKAALGRSVIVTKLAESVQLTGKPEFIGKRKSSDDTKRKIDKVVIVGDEKIGFIVDSNQNAEFQESKSASKLGALDDANVFLKIGAIINRLNKDITNDKMLDINDENSSQTFVSPSSEYPKPRPLVSKVEVKVEESPDVAVLDMLRADDSPTGSPNLSRSTSKASSLKAKPVMSFTGKYTVPQSPAASNSAIANFTTTASREFIPLASSSNISTSPLLLANDSFIITSASASSLSSSPLKHGRRKSSLSPTPQNSTTPTASQGSLGVLYSSLIPSMTKKPEEASRSTTLTEPFDSPLGARSYLQPHALPKKPDELASTLLSTSPVRPQFNKGSAIYPVFNNVSAKKIEEQRPSTPEEVFSTPEEMSPIRAALTKQSPSKLFSTVLESKKHVSPNSNSIPKPLAANYTASTSDESEAWRGNVQRSNSMVSNVSNMMAHFDKKVQDSPLSLSRSASGTSKPADDNGPSGSILGSMRAAFEINATKKSGPVK